jgi:cytochrome P450
MVSTVSLLGAGITGLLAYYLVFRRSSPSSSLPLPPGPPKLPIIGNVHQAPKSHAWLQFTQWARQYGPVMHLNMMGQDIIVLSTSQAAHDLLAKRGASFSDRPKMFVAQELALKHMNTLLMDYDDRFKLHQKLEGIVLNQNASAKYREFQSLESKQLLFDMLKVGASPGVDIRGVVNRTIASNILALFYGFRLTSPEAPELKDILKIDEEFSEFVQVGAFLVDTFPVLNILPGPLAPWKAKAEGHYQRQLRLHTTNLKRGLAEPGWTFSKQLHGIVEEENLPIPFHELAIELGTMLDAALDGTVESTIWFLIACITQDKGFVAKAREELDRVVGRDRLPVHDDAANLPFVSAIVEETLRWRPAAAGGVPHFTKTESTYNGYLIPAGSVVIPNHWGILRDEAAFGPDTDDFIPERWLDEDNKGALKSLPVAGFGWGRRLCPGRHVARNILWVIIARCLWAFEIKAGLSEDGKPTEVEYVDSTDGLAMRAKPFKASFTPRDEKARKIIEEECYTHDVDIAPILTRLGADLPQR